ncbi:unnamed protein product [Spirodela intermedia]|uniref:Uncharacterized protein n=2 Tax=Spirodela intermedia TaxID=51605 RepID=A0A7I8KEJ9_SPIIN|nr:unnamed protein product [Spirodela intermedia]
MAPPQHRPLLPRRLELDKFLPLLHWQGDGENAGGIGEDADMQELVMLVLRNSTGPGRCTLQTFLAVAKSLYYVASCPPAALELHIDKVLFQTVD